MAFNRSLINILGKIAPSYDRFREDYPLELFNDIGEYIKLKGGKRTLEVGCGTGIATLSLARMNLEVTALDINERMIDMARINGLANVNYVIGSFEKSNFKSNSFDIIAAAQSWHWLDRRIAYEKAHDLLTPSGTLALFWKFQDERSDLVSDINKLFSKYCPDYPADFGSLTSIKDELKESDIFDSKKESNYQTIKKISKKDLICLITTYSWVLNLPDHKPLLNDLASRLEKEDEVLDIPYKYTLLMAKKK